MNCRQMERLLLEGETKKLESAEATLHLSGCSVCRERRQAWAANRLALAGLGELSPLTAPLSHALARRQAESRPPALPLYRRPPLVIATAACAALPLLGLGIHFVQGTRRTAPVPTLASGTHSSDTMLTRPKSENRGDAVAKEASSPSVGSGNGTYRVNVKADTAWPAPHRKTGIVSPHPASVMEDMAYVNGGGEAAWNRWTQMPPDEAAAMEAHWQQILKRGDDFVAIPFPTVASCGRAGMAAALASYEQQATAVDTRLVRKITLQQKGMAFSDLCALLTTQTGIQFKASRGVADDKVTLFCKDRPLRDILRQITHVFHFSWSRDGSGKPDDPYTYELVQDLKSQFTEEELRNRDRNAALLALDTAMNKYRKYLSLTPEQAREQALTASPEEKEILDGLGGGAWAAAHLYFSLSPSEMADLQSGKELQFAPKPGSGQLALPPDMASGTLHSLDNYRIQAGTPMPGQPAPFQLGSAQNLPGGVPPAAYPGAEPNASLQISGSELGQFTLAGRGGFSVTSPDGGGKGALATGQHLAVGVSPSVQNPDNAAANARLARDPALQGRVTVAPKPSSPLETGAANAETIAKVTTADVLEALHKTTGLDIVADYFTRLYDPNEVMIKETRLFDTLCHLSNTMHDRWNKEEGWLQFRSAGYFNDRIKEVPNRLLTRWASAGRKNGHLSLNDLAEVASLTDSQLDAKAMAEGANVLYGLKEWEQAAALRANLRFLATLSANQREAAQSEAGLSIARLPLQQQEQMLALAYPANQRELNLGTEDLAATTLHLHYSDKPLPEPQLIKRPRPGGPGGQRVEQRITQQSNSTNGASPASPWQAVFTYRYGGVHSAAFTHIIRAHGDSMMSSGPGAIPQP